MPRFFARRRPSVSHPTPVRCRLTVEGLECRIIPDAQFQASASALAANLNGVIARDQTAIATWNQQLQQTLLAEQVKASTGIQNDELAKAAAQQLYQRLKAQADANAAAQMSEWESQKARIEDSQFTTEAQRQQTVQEIEALPPSRATDDVKERLIELENERASYETQQLNQEYADALAMGDKADAQQQTAAQAAVQAQREQLIEKIDSLSPNQSTGAVEQQMLKQGNQWAADDTQRLGQEFKDANAAEKQVTAEQQKEIDAAAAELKSTWKTMNTYERFLEDAWKNADKAAVARYNALLRRAQNDMRNALSRYKKALGILTQQEIKRQMQGGTTSYNYNSFDSNGIPYSSYYDSNSYPGYSYFGYDNNAPLSPG